MIHSNGTMTLDLYPLLHAIWKPTCVIKRTRELLAGVICLWKSVAYKMMPHCWSSVAWHILPCLFAILLWLDSVVEKLRKLWWKRWDLFYIGCPQVEWVVKEIKFGFSVFPACNLTWYIGHSKCNSPLILASLFGGTQMFWIRGTWSCEKNFGGPFFLSFLSLSRRVGWFFFTVVVLSCRQICKMCTLEI